MGVFLKILVSNSAVAAARRVRREEEEEEREVVAAVAEAERRVRPLVPSQLEPVCCVNGGEDGWESD